MESTYLIFSLLYLSVLCTGIPLRLVPGPQRGLLQIFHNNTWGTICDDRFHQNEADVACRHLGLNTLNNRVYIIKGSGAIWVRSIRCRGDEGRLEQCSDLIVQHISACNHGEDVAIACYNGTKSFVSINEHNSTHNEGSYMRLVCSVHGTTAYSTVWLQNSQETGFSNSLLFTRVKRNMVGNWTCLVEDLTTNTTLSDTTILTVLYPPVEFSQTLVYAQVGKQVPVGHVDCLPHPHVYRWRKMGKPSPLKVASVQPVLEHLQISDAGEYYMEVENSLGSGRQLFTIVIPYAPKVKCNKEIKCYVTDSITLVCTIQSSPAPDIVTWTFSTKISHDPNSISKSSKVLRSGISSTYTINSLQTSDSGVYTCTALNTIPSQDGGNQRGAGNCDITLIVQATREEMFTSSQAPITVSVGTNSGSKEASTGISSTTLYATGAVLVAVIAVLLIILIVITTRQRRMKANISGESS